MKDTLETAEILIGWLKFYENNNDNSKCIIDDLKCKECILMSEKKKKKEKTKQRLEV